MQRLKAILGYAGAILTVVIMLAMPFVLFDLFTRAVAGTGVQVDPIYSGGAPARTLPRGGYVIVVHEPVHSRALLARPVPFVQMTWIPAAALPPHVADSVDVDGDGMLDLVVAFDVPADTTAPLFVDVVPLGGHVGRLTHVSSDGISSMIVRVNGRILVRTPLVQD